MDMLFHVIPRYNCSTQANLFENFDSLVWGRLETLLEEIDHSRVGLEELILASLPAQTLCFLIRTTQEAAATGVHRHEHS